MQTEKAAIAKMSYGAFMSSLTAITLNEWVAIATLVYFILQIALLMPKIIKMVKGWLK